MDFDEIEEDDGHEVAITVRFTVEAGQDHLERFREVREAIESTAPDDADISHSIDMMPVDNEGEVLF